MCKYIVCLELKFCDCHTMTEGRFIITEKYRKRKSDGDKYIKLRINNE